MAKILAVASGKGGVGKTFFVTNLCMALAQQQQKVIAVDLDLGSSNLHTMLGIKNNLLSIGHFIADYKNTNFSDLVHPTTYPDLAFIPGDSLFLGTANLPYYVKIKIINELKKLSADWIVIDLGSGCSFNTLDFYLISECKILLTNLEITSILNLYSFLKNALFRHIIHQYKRNDAVRVDLVKAMKMKLEKEDLLFVDLLKQVMQDFPAEKENLTNIINNFSPKILINTCEELQDINIGKKLKEIISRNLGLDLEYLGILPYDKQVSDSIVTRKPFYDLNSNSDLCNNINKIAARLVNYHDYPLKIYNDSMDSFEIISSDIYY